MKTRTDNTVHYLLIPSELQFGAEHQHSLHYGMQRLKLKLFRKYKVAENIFYCRSTN